MKAHEKNIQVETVGDFGSLKLIYPDGHSFELCSGILTNDPARARTEILRWIDACSRPSTQPIIDPTMGALPSLDSSPVSV